jgi:hypothetical protein
MGTNAGRSDAAGCGHAAAVVLLAAYLVFVVAVALR